MSTTPHAHESELTTTFESFVEKYYHDDLLEFAGQYPDTQTFPVTHGDLHRYDPDLADDWLQQPEQLAEYAEEALRLFDIPVDISLAGAEFAVTGLPDHETYYPGDYSPTDRAGTYLAIQGEISRASDVYSRITDAAFECQRCGTLTRIPQGDSGFQEPHECEGCERQGPFQVNFDQSEFVDGQKLRVQTPPEVAQGVSQDLDVVVEGDDLTDAATVGDRVTITGVLHIHQSGSKREKTGRFEPYLEGYHISVEETDHTQVDVASEDRKEIQRLANGGEGDPLDLAAESLAPKIYGYHHIKRMAVLLMVGGSRTVYPSGDADRGDFHMLLLGDPGTAKSKLVGQVESKAPRSVGVSGKGATQAGLTASAVQDDFGDGDWTLKAGAFVKANDGVVAIDELDDMDPDVRASMLEPMSRQSIHKTAGGINASLSTRAGVIAAGNPVHGRFDPYQPVQEQFAFDSALLSRFDLIYTLSDEPDEEEDRKIAGHILEARDAAKRQMRGDTLSEGERATIDPPVAPDILRKWIALASQQPAPPFANQSVKQELEDSFTSLRGAYGYDEDGPVPTTFRNLEAIVRIAEAAAKFEFSGEIEKRHADIAIQAVGRSMNDYGKNEDDQLDADVRETGTSHSQAQKMKVVQAAVDELSEDYENGVPMDQVAKTIEEIPDDAVWDVMDKALRDGLAVEPVTDSIRWVGRA